ncbi:DUF1566 domain-containing protein [Agarivorans sp. 1_MG-2023]|uniref:PKD domain-containing protein n=1 Tax=Agarivorans sp. 1_MG-2023 TaxID=3062634 RepID=UPI0026E14E87|nr:DUF1566 domain-containing protein [Agarivorans sp. 1_MG-2023]MDO6762554.1 DUF1566 domain-containing protein [Agarivorans sp. 1_MG-2023]
MIREKVFSCLIMLLACLVLSACNHDDSTNVSQTNRILVSAGPDFQVNENLPVLVTAEVQDDFNQLSEMAWHQLSGIDVELDSTQASILRFNAPSVNAKQVLTFAFTARSQAGKQYSDSLVVTVLNINQAPTIELASEMAVAEQQSVLINPLVTDADNHTLDIQWRQILLDNQTPLTISDPTQLQLNIQIPTLSTAQTYQFELSATDSEQASTSSIIQLNAFPALKGRVIDEPLAQAVVTLKDWQSGLPLAQTHTDDNGNFQFLLDNSSSNFRLDVSGGMLNNQSFLGLMNGACTFDTRSQCNVTPISSLVLSYAARNSLQDLSQQDQWINTIEDLIGEISPDPFLSNDSSNLRLDVIRTAMGSQGENIQTWITQVLDFLSQPNDPALALQTEPWFEKINLPPIISANLDQTVDEQTTVNLSAIASDSDGSISGYIWQQTSGPIVNLQDANTANAYFLAPEVISTSILQFELTVTDNETSSTSDSVTITINDNLPPNAKISAPLLTNGTDLVLLDGSQSNDTETDTLQYLWRQIDNTGINLSFIDSSFEQVQFTAPNVANSQVLTVELTVTDEGGKIATEELSIAIAPNDANLAAINDTGINQCGDYAFGSSGLHHNELDCTLGIDLNGDVIPTPQDGQDGRDLNFASNNDGRLGFSFIKLDSQGQPLDASATEWSCVLDTTTQVIWEVKTNDGGLQDSNNTYSWLDNNGTRNGGNIGTADGGSCPDADACDTEGFTASINALTLCGLNNWRVPNLLELQSLLDYSKITFAIDSNYFPNTNNTWHWSSDTIAAADIGAWRVNFDLSVIDVPFGLKSSQLPVRLIHDLP